MFHSLDTYIVAWISANPNSQKNTSPSLPWQLVIILWSSNLCYFTIKRIDREILYAMPSAGMSKSQKSKILLYTHIGKSGDSKNEKIIAILVILKIAES